MVRFSMFLLACGHVSPDPSFGQSGYRLPYFVNPPATAGREIGPSAP
jgi:hypothetical protein